MLLEKMKPLPEQLENKVNELLDKIEAEGSQQLSDYDAELMRLLTTYQEEGYMVAKYCDKYIKIQKGINYESIGEEHIQRR